MPVGETIHRLERVPSTNDAARALAVDGAAHGTVVVAAEQTKGRGTKGRSWHSPAGLGLYASFILRGPGGGPVPYPHLLPLAAGLAASDAVRESAGFEPRLKWPNDIVHDGKKLGGILSEAVSAGTDAGFAVVGIGLNAGHGPADFPDELRTSSTSVRLAAGRTISVETLLGALCRALDHWYNVLARGARGEIVRTFEARSALAPGQALRLETAEGIFEAEYRGLDAEGRLVVARCDGTTTAVDAVLKLDRAF
jgi:BirA family transcriptional regulator, biotin operon repressor / biotin---[acetyl-CoA-carboxylase] ligase